eukprot:scaffold1808_cov389-Alexandrium_tamarense.AAC.1
MLNISGLSLALCELHKDESVGGELTEDNTPSDDVSALTGFSDSDDASVANQPRERIVPVTFDPMSQFWSTTRHGFCHDPIFLMHMSDLALAAKHVEENSAHQSLLECEFSVGSIAVHGDALLPSEKKIFSLGEMPCVEVLGKDVRYLLRSRGETALAPCLSGLIHTGSVSPDEKDPPTAHLFINIAASSILADWHWFKHLASYSSASRDIEPARILGPLENEDELVMLFSIAKQTALANTGLHLEFDRVAVSVPARSGKDCETHLMLSVDSSLFQIGNPSNGCDLDREAASSQLLSPETMLRFSSNAESVSPFYMSGGEISGL